MRGKATEYIYRILVTMSMTTGAMLFIFLLFWLIFSGREFLSPYTLAEFLFSSEWKPENGRFGILVMLISSVVTAFLSTAVSTVTALFSAGFIYLYFTNSAAQKVLRITAVLSGMPSVLFGLIGMTVIVPWIGQNITQAQKSGGASLMSTAAVLSLMIIPMMTVTFYESMSSLDRRIISASDALGATKTETLFGCMLPMIKGMRKTSFSNAFRRAVGEATAVILVSGNVSGAVGLFSPIKTLAGTLVLEMGYADKTHRSALFAIGFVLLIITMLIPSGRDTD